jgi:phosphatidate phosphatase
VVFDVPHHRGFFCDDQSLMLPLHESTVTYTIVYSLGFSIPIIIIIIAEIVRWNLHMDIEKEMELFGRNIPIWVQNLYKYIGIFLFGVVCNQMITNLGKHVVGRLRPHFISLCKPTMHDGSNCTDAQNLNHYIEEFDCFEWESRREILKEMRLSFPSWHASFSMYTMVFTALYLQCRLKWKGSKLMKHFLQLILIVMALYIAQSRIFDNQSHCKNFC